MGAHALLSPSAAARWMSCTPSARMEEKMPDRETEFAKEGTLAHALAEAKVWERYGTGKPEDMDGLRREGLYAPEMEEHTDAYADYVHGLYAKHRETTPDAVLMTEQRLDFTKYIPDGFGTADAVIVAEGMMEVVDFKYGKGVEVSAVENGQMMVYALGALEKWDYLYPIERVRMTIFQPRIGNVSEWEITATALRKWGEEELKPKAAKAFKGEGEATPGGWCRFCKAKAVCRALADFCTADIADGTPDARLMGAEEVSKVLPKAEILKGWVPAVEEHALGLALGGTRVPGYKVVEGRSVRKYADEKAVVDKLFESGYGEDTIYRPRELETISAMEHKLTKKVFAALLGGLVFKPQGKPTLVPESDKRPELNTAVTDFEGIEV